MSRTTACPLDCYDACSVSVSDDGKLQGTPEHPYTQGFLCPHLNHYDKHERITQPRYKGEDISMDEAVTILKEKVKGCVPSSLLHYRGSGNFGLMQQVTDHVFAGYGATLTRGSLCDGAGEAGIVEGRGRNYALSPEQISKAEVVIFWGRNPHTTNSHLLPLLKDKTIIVIDPVQTEMADQADLFLQIKPHGDLQFALMLARFIMIEGLEDKEFVEAYAEEYEEFFDLTQTIRIKASLEAIDLSLGNIGDVLELVRGKRTVILPGVGIQKYRNGADIMRAIDAIGVLLGLFGKEGCGVSYLGSSSEGIESPFELKASREPKATVDFSKFELVFVQGANPLSQMPDTRRAEAGLKAAESVVYFGLYENETSEAADLVIPAKSFLEKADIRSSYGHDALLSMPCIRESEVGISEYDLAHAVNEVCGVELKSEADYIGHFTSFGELRDGMMKVKGREAIPYKDGFDTDDGQFLFLEELDLGFDLDNDLFLLTAKSPKSLNSQFNRESVAHVSPQSGFLDGQRLRIVSTTGSVELTARHDTRVRSDCVLIYSGTPGVNYLTPSLLSYEGENAIYQENKVRVEIC